MRNLNVVMLMLTGTVCGVVVLVAFSPLITGKALSETKAKMMVGIITSMISIISMYVGAKIQQDKGILGKSRERVEKNGGSK